MPTPQDESVLFRASCYTSLFDFLKTDIAIDKGIVCMFPYTPLDQSLSRDLSKKGVKWIEFKNTEKLYPPNYEPNFIQVKDPKELVETLNMDSTAKHYFCGFNKDELTYPLKYFLNKTKAESLSFSDGQSLYPPFT